MEKLTPREGEVVSLAAKGFTDKEIAQQLGVRFKTIRTHWDRVFWKLDARSRMHAFAIWIGWTQ